MGHIPAWRVRNKKQKDVVYLPGETKFSVWCLLTYKLKRLGWERDISNYAFQRVPDLDNKIYNNDITYNIDVARRTGLIVDEGNASYAFCSIRSAKRYVWRKQKPTLDFIPPMVALPLK